MFQTIKSPALIFNYIDNSTQGKIVHLVYHQERIFCFVFVSSIVYTHFAVVIQNTTRELWTYGR